MELEVNRQKLFLEILADMGDERPPNPDDGWFTVRDLLDQAEGLTIYQIRDKINKMVDDRLLEKRRYGIKLYYRKVK